MSKTIYILIGPQGSGKTYWATNTLMRQPGRPIMRLSQDEQGKHHHRIFQTSIKSRISIVVDRMNLNRAQRDRYTKPARQSGYSVIFVLFDINRRTCLERLATRKNHPTISVDADHNKILNVYFDQFEPPSCDEYDEILHICSKRTANLLDLRNICQGERVIVVGDIHGYFNEFMSLLAKCEYRAGDIVVATGDLVDRGPRIRETLQWFRDTPGAYSVEGNHDNKYRRHLIGNPVKIVNGLDCTIEQCADLDKTEWAAWFQYLPQMIRIGDIGIKPTYVVHAGIDGGKSIYSQHVETCLYSRYLRGSDFYDDNNGVLWWETLDDTYNIIGGHIICEDPHPVNSAYCLDGGICDGGVLRGMVIDGDGDDVMVHEVNSNG